MGGRTLEAMALIGLGLERFSICANPWAEINKVSIG
jgi:signal transduction protein with GAF and PtsI domain